MISLISQCTTQAKEDLDDSDDHDSQDDSDAEDDDPDASEHDFRNDHQKPPSSLTRDGWPFRRLTGDDQHSILLEHFDRNFDQSVSWKEASARGALRRHFDYYDTDSSGILEYQEFMKFARERNLYLARSDEELNGPAPKGHLQPLGAHSNASLPVDILDGPVDPQVFWSSYIEQHRPVLLRGVDKGVAWEKWDEGYIRDKFNWVNLKVEPKIESRGDDSILDKLPKRLTIDKYFDRMRTTNLYAVSVLPQAMAWEVNFPSSMLCGGRKKQRSRVGSGEQQHLFPHPSGRDWLTHLYEANLWLGHGRTRSQLHYDKENNVNCLYRGEKKWIMIDTRQHFDDVLWVRGGRFKKENDLLNMGTDWVAIDPDKVDLRVHKRMRNVKYYEFTQQAGDCVFIPYAMLHWVNKTSPGFQAAVSYMFVPEEKYDAQACKRAPKVNIPMGAMDILWYYNGTGVIPQGYPDPMKDTIPALKAHMDDQNTNHLTQRVIKAFCDADEAICKGDPAAVRRFWQRLSKWGAQPDKGLHAKEMLPPPSGKVPLGEWLKFAAEADPEGMLPCDEGEQYVPRSPEEATRMDRELSRLESESDRSMRPEL